MKIRKKRIVKRKCPPQQVYSAVATAMVNGGDNDSTVYGNNKLNRVQFAVKICVAVSLTQEKQ